MSSAKGEIDHGGRFPESTKVDRDRFLLHLTPVVEALGFSLVEPSDEMEGDVAVRWDGEVVGYVQGPELHGALDRMVSAIEREIGRRFEDMNRSQKQSAVRLLDQRGAFLLRGAVEDIARIMGVSRVTLYTYLNAIDAAQPEQAVD